jgi:hypothetical protein
VGITCGVPGSLRLLPLTQAFATTMPPMICLHMHGRRSFYWNVFGPYFLSLPLGIMMAVRCSLRSDSAN